MPEPETESPQRIISDRYAFEIYSPENGTRIHAVVVPDYTVTTSVEQIKNRTDFFHLVQSAN